MNITTGKKGKEVKCRAVFVPSFGKPSVMLSLFSYNRDFKNEIDRKLGFAVIYFQIRRRKGEKAQPDTRALFFRKIWR